eukprot:5345973-Amphidinium_carterae.1
MKKAGCTDYKSGMPTITTIKKTQQNNDFIDNKINKSDKIDQKYDLMTSRVNKQKTKYNQQLKKDTNSYYEMSTNQQHPTKEEPEDDHLQLRQLQNHQDKQCSTTMPQQWTNHNHKLLRYVNDKSATTTTTDHYGRR